MSKIWKWKQFTTMSQIISSFDSCFWYVKDMKMKAIHNNSICYSFLALAVSDMSKIWKWKQFTTLQPNATKSVKLFLICQRYENESNSQLCHRLLAPLTAVSDMSKIWKWKQFTTTPAILHELRSCFWYVKDMKMKAIHN